jgi:molybdopterin-containing oxidoreductase family iron-sulfur binding subunit
MNRRTFLKIAGMGSLAFTAGCTLETEKKLYSLVKTPADMVTGEALWYASTCLQCPAGCGVLAKNREGRVIKLEGNPFHPVNKGKLCMRGQAALQGVYNPDRLNLPLLKKSGRFQPISHQEARELFREKINLAAAGGAGRIRMMTRLEGESLLALFAECLNAWQSPSPVIYEPFSYENLKKANEVVFGVNGLCRYRMDQADCLVSFGADFLETWLSPVEYARQFKAMHAYQNGRKGMFYHVGACRTLTGANADQWIKCPPGGEAAVCLAIINAILNTNAGSSLSPGIGNAIHDLAGPYTRSRVVDLTGISVDQFEEMVRTLMAAENPLVLGTGCLAHCKSDLQANIAVNLLNALLDPGLRLLDFKNPHRIEKAGGHARAAAFFEKVIKDAPEIVILNNVNPVYAMAGGKYIKAVFGGKAPFIISFSNFLDETSQAADLVIPTALALESWGEYGSGSVQLSTLQPAMPPLNGAPAVGDLFLYALGKNTTRHQSIKHYMLARLEEDGLITDQPKWLAAVQKGGIFSPPSEGKEAGVSIKSGFSSYFKDLIEPENNGTPLLVLPSLRFFDGRGANLPWLCEIPDPVTKVAWQTPLMVYPETAAKNGLSHGSRLEISAGDQKITAMVYETKSVMPGVFAMHTGQGHGAYGRYAENRGANPFRLLTGEYDPASGALLCRILPVSFSSLKTGPGLAHTDGSPDQHGRKIALTTSLSELGKAPPPKKHGLTMHDFPLTLPLPEGYDPKRDFYPPHDHEDYRWAMVVDLDRCIGCNACAAACYAENNIGVVGEEQVINGREMSWMHIERYEQIGTPEKLIFLPMLCQHCDNAPCESVCPVYAPHHSKEGLNNQIYNRCIGTRFCAQNCPYKVRRFNWLEWEWPKPLNLQLNPDVTVRTKGVMEKCSFCIQRIKAAHNQAKNEGRMIEDGEVTPACVQTCPTDALVFGSLMDENSRVSRLVRDRRAYQVMGYLNTKPAVIYLKKVVEG